MNKGSGKERVNEDLSDRFIETCDLIAKLLTMDDTELK